MTSETGGGEKTERLSPRIVAISLLLLTAGGLAVRLHGIGQSLVAFHPTRHYRSANIARACHYDATPDVPEWARQVARANRSMQPAGEPPIMEWLACRSYGLLGYEDIRVPRALVALSWLLGACPLYLLARRLSSPAAALVGAAVYIFIPYGIVATRTFQPDALMTLCALLAMLAVVRAFERPTSPRLLAGGALIALAAVVKPMSIFLTLPVVFGMAARQPWRRLVADRRVLVLVGLGVTPAAIFYGYGALFGTLARDQMRMRFVPALLTSEFFWSGWFTQVRRVFGLALFFVSLAGTILTPSARSRALLAALWVGYAAFAVAFTYHMPTHDYYHLPYIAVVALGVSAMLERLRVVIAGRVSPGAEMAAAIGLAVAIAVWGSSSAWPRLTIPHAEETVARFNRIGELTGHDPRVLFLDLEYGYSLMYHGQLSGDAWPNLDDLAAESLGGMAPLSAEARFARDFANYRPRYFVATDLQSLAAEPDLRQLLADRTVPVEKTGTYHVYRFVDQRTP